MNKLILLGLVLAFGANAEYKINPNGGGYNTDDNGAWSTDGTRLNQAGPGNDTYFGTDGGIYQREGNTIRQTGGFQDSDKDDYGDNYSDDDYYE